MNRRGILAAAWIVILSIVFLPHAHAGISLHLKAKSAILMNMNDGSILYAQNPDRPIAPASLTKVLSLYLVYEAITEGKVHLDDMVRISKRAWRTGGSKMYVQVGKQIPLEELMKGMAIVSGNDACVAVAEHFGGVDYFVKLMNLKARQLGMTHSLFKNPNGLPARGQVTTARDILTLSSKYLSRFPEALGMHSIQYFTHGKITQINHNRLLQKVPDVDGLKTGFVSAAGFHIVATAKRGDVRLIAVVMGSKNPRIRTKETRILLEEGFRMVERDSPRIRKVHAVYDSIKKAGTEA